MGAGLSSTLCFFRGGGDGSTVSGLRSDTDFWVNLGTDVEKLHVCAWRWPEIVVREGDLASEDRRSDRGRPVALGVINDMVPFRVTDRLER